jgi:hypothetical protein
MDKGTAKRPVNQWASRRHRDDELQSAVKLSLERRA